MQKISPTFCPAKWDELFVSHEVNYAYACCKSKPSKFTDNIMEFVDKEKLNLLNGVQDPSCDYCWKVEKFSNNSLRHQYLEKFDKSTYDQYVTNQVKPTYIQISVGNECNFQCTYCNPKFSSKWESDVNQQPYKVFTDRFFYSIDPSNNNLLDRNIDFLKTFDRIKKLSIIGGEPLLNKQFFKIIDNVPAYLLQTTTNLSIKKSIIDKFLTSCLKFEKVRLGISLDSTGRLAEFTRFGLEFDTFADNLNYLLANKPNNLIIELNSLMTSITIRDIEQFSQFIMPNLDKLVAWNISYCKDPRIQSLETLPNQYKDQLIQVFSSLLTYKNINGPAMIIDLLNNVKFNNTLYQELKHFLKEFSERKKIEIPICLD
jgi:MoaA/NifB/PqqE/SkfB family radical SAM enzyme